MPDDCEVTYAAIWDDQDLTSTEKLVMIYLKSHAYNQNGSRVFTSHARIADRTNLAVTTIGRAIRTLTRRGYIEKRLDAIAPMPTRGAVYAIKDK